MVDCCKFMQRVMELAYSYEEADGKLLLHVSAAIKGFFKIDMQSPDTDVAVIGVSHCGIGAIDSNRHTSQETIC